MQNPRFQTEESPAAKTLSKDTADRINNMIGFNRANFPNYRRRRCNPMYSIDKLSHIFSFLDLIAQNLSVDHLKSVHQNPLAYIKTDKEEDLLQLIAKDDRFKGMMEVYALFRDVISHGLMADLSEKSSRVYKMAFKLDEVQEKLTYIEEAKSVWKDG